MNWSVQQILNELIQLDEHQRIEAKRATEIGHSVIQTICAFANEPRRWMVTIGRFRVR